MDFELWWLLPIPVLFFGLGWIAARIDIKHLLRESRALPLSYFRGLNFLLNEQPDKAIESFIEVVKVDPQTVDLHFALGSLFRRQGEIERATRMHQNLLDRPNLPPDKREAGALRARAGLPSRGPARSARRALHEARRTTFEHPSLGFLISIYEQEKDWPKAIAVTRRMEAIAKRPYFKEIAHYYCELAQAALLKQDIAAARANIEHALAEVPGVHASDDAARRSRIAGRQRRRGDRRMAADRIAELRVPVARRRAARRCLPPPGHTAQALRVIGAYQRDYPSLDLLNTMFTLTLAEEGSEAAGTLIKEELARNPTLLGLDRLLEAQLLAAPAERRHDLELVKQLVGQHIKRLGLYKCEHCGFRARQYYWRCPGCGKWETYSPRRTEAPDGFA
jgi:lipopolysaccharide biosynthesis regulator YciM